MYRKFGIASLMLVLFTVLWTAPTWAKEKADLILYDAKVLTVDSNFSIKSAVVVRGERIIAVGGDELRTKYEATNQIDLHGRTLMPGFTDTHLHPQPVKPSDIDVASAHSIVEVQAMLRKKADELGPGKWITVGAGRKRISRKIAI